MPQHKHNIICPHAPAPSAHLSHISPDPSPAIIIPKHQHCPSIKADSWKTYSTTSSLFHTQCDRHTSQIHFSNQHVQLGTISTFRQTKNNGHLVGHKPLSVQIQGTFTVSIPVHHPIIGCLPSSHFVISPLVIPCTPCG